MHNFLESLAGVLMGVLILCLALLWYGHVSNKAKEKDHNETQVVVVSASQPSAQTDPQTAK